MTTKTEVKISRQVTFKELVMFGFAASGRFCFTCTIPASFYRKPVTLKTRFLFKKSATDVCQSVYYRDFLNHQSCADILIG
jgi:hypothetical protein